MTAVLTTYLQDHHAGSAAGVDVFERVAQDHGDPHVRSAVASLAEQVRADQDSLEAIMRSVGASASTVKDLGARVGEKAARLKPNERLAARSPLSDVIELETLMLAVHGKALGFRALLDLDDARLDRAELERLIARADAQEAELSDLRRSQLAKLRDE